MEINTTREIRRKIFVERGIAYSTMYIFAIASQIEAEEQIAKEFKANVYSRGMVINKYILH